MSLSVVDTNVLVVANGRSPTADHDCMLQSVRALTQIKKSQSLILDRDGLILCEYSKHCRYSGEPGLGDEFFAWAHENQGWLRRFVLSPHAGRYFEEFPADPALATFDWDDRMFVAVSIAAVSEDPPAPNWIVNAVDSDYSHHRAALTGAGVVVQELCPGLLKAPPAPKTRARTAGSSS